MLCWIVIHICSFVATAGIMDGCWLWFFSKQGGCVYNKSISYQLLWGWSPKYLRFCRNRLSLRHNRLNYSSPPICFYILVWWPNPVVNFNIFILLPEYVTKIMKSSSAITSEIHFKSFLRVKFIAMLLWSHSFKLDSVILHIEMSRCSCSCQRFPNIWHWCLLNASPMI